MKGIMLLTVVLCFVVPITALSRTWYIKPDGTGDAPTIQAGIDSASTGDEVLLSDGLFTGDGNRDISFETKSITVRSESGDPDWCIIDCQGSEAEPHRGFGFGQGTGPGSVLQGVTIMNGHWENGGGGAIACYNASPTISDVVLCSSFARFGGGGMECHTQSSPIVSNVLFLDNSTRGGDVAGGGGLYCCDGSRPILTECVFEGNSSYRWGGAIHCRRASPSFSGCIIANNSSDTYAGGVWFFESAPAFTNVTFYGNSAPNGSGVYGNSHEPGWVATFDNVIIAYGKLSRSVILSYQAEALFTCCDIYGNPGVDWPPDIEDQCGVRGNFSACPSFCCAENGDFHLCDESPCLPGNHPDGYDCGLIGAIGEGCSCEPTKTERSTWGAIKSMYR